MTPIPETLPPGKAKPAQTPLERIVRRIFRWVLILLILSGILFLLNLDTLLGAHPNLPAAGQELSYALLFIAGTFTGFHCVGMCGALVVGYTVKAASTGLSRYLTHLYYGAGKTLSYTVIGGLFGSLGAIVTFTPFMRGVAGLAAGVFLLLFGLSTLNAIPALARFRIRTPAFVMKRLGVAFRSNSNPFIVGLLNGLMIICGPLQAMYIMAAGTGRPLEGAKMLFVFGLGTLPVMLSFGILTSALSKQFAPRIVKASGVIVIALGFIMINRGLAMTGSGYDMDSLRARWWPGSAPLESHAHGHGHLHGLPFESASRTAALQTARLRVVPEGFEPPVFIIRPGIPVRWIIGSGADDACGGRLDVPSLKLEIILKPGENVVEFTPVESGVLSWNCQNGRLNGAFLVNETRQPPTMPDSGHDHASMAGHDPGSMGGHAQGRPTFHWMRELLEKSAAAVETLRRTLVP